MIINQNGGPGFLEAKCGISDSDHKQTIEPSVRDTFSRNTPIWIMPLKIFPNWQNRGISTINAQIDTRGNSGVYDIVITSIE